MTLIANIIKAAFTLITLITISIGALKAKADEMEQGLSYSCNAQELRIETISKSGGGPTDPYIQFEDKNHALWNIGRMYKQLPKVKICEIGDHKISTVVTVGFHDHWDVTVPTVALYENANIYVDTKHNLIVDTIKANAHPFLEAKQFGGAVIGDSEGIFENIIVRLNTSENQNTLTVEMK